MCDVDMYFLHSLIMKMLVCKNIIIPSFPLLWKCQFGKTSKIKHVHCLKKT